MFSKLGWILFMVIIAILILLAIWFFILGLFDMGVGIILITLLVLGLVYLNM